MYQPITIEENLIAERDKRLYSWRAFRLKSDKK